MKTCGLCARTYRKGSLAVVMTDRGLKSKRVCQDCADKGITLVAAMPAVRCKCGKPATKCHVCAGTKSGDLAGAIKVLEGRLKARKLMPVASMDEHAVETNDGVIEGLESAIELLKSGRF
jgi:hypothetical protein